MYPRSLTAGEADALRRLGVTAADLNTQTAPTEEGPTR